MTATEDLRELFDHQRPDVLAGNLSVSVDLENPDPVIVREYATCKSAFPSAASFAVDSFVIRDASTSGYAPNHP